ncbi:MAG: immunity 17 family protein [Bacteroidaceae bacterium]|nr:immunity 17 family protein [Bacteroidaceae bacterium]
MIQHYIVQGIFALSGFISLLAAISNWEWFFSSRNAKSLLRNTNRKRARIFYGILGIILIFMATFFFFATKKAVA